MPSLIRSCVQEARHALRGQLALVVPSSSDRDHQQATIPITSQHPPCQYEGHFYGVSALQFFGRSPPGDAGLWASSGVRIWPWGLAGQQSQAPWDHDVRETHHFQAFDWQGGTWLDEQFRQDSHLQMEQRLAVQWGQHGAQHGAQPRQHRQNTPQSCSYAALPSALSAETIPAGPNITELSAEQADAMVAWLTEGSSEERAFAMEQIAGLLWPLAATQQGSRVVQKVLEIADGSEQTALIAQLEGRVCEASKSPHANYVLQRCIRVLPTKRLQFVLDELKGRAVVTARHRCGCRILQRLLERGFPHEQTAGLVAEVMSDADRLCRHPFGNFVLQHILDHGTDSQRSAVVCAVLPDARGLARHRIASHVLQRALARSSGPDRERLTLALAPSAEERRSLVHSQYGSFVMREVASLER